MLLRMAERCPTLLALAPTPIQPVLEPPTPTGAAAADGRALPDTPQLWPSPIRTDPRPPPIPPPQVVRRMAERCPGVAWAVEDALRMENRADGRCASPS